MKNILHFIHKIVFKRGNLLFFFFLVSSFFSRLNSQLSFIDVFGQLSFQILIFGILLFFILLILKRLLTSMICILICVLLTIDILSSCNQCNAFIKDTSQSYNKIRLMTFNTGLSEDFDNIIELVLFEKPDVIQFQEVSPQMQNKLKSLKPFFPYDTGLNKPLEHFSSIILSKYPLKNNEAIDNYAVLTRVILDDSELTIIGIHLFAPLPPIITRLAFIITHKNFSVPPVFNKASFNIAINQMNYLKTLVGNANKNLIIYLLI